MDTNRDIVDLISASNRDNQQKLQERLGQLAKENNELKAQNHHLIEELTESKKRYDALCKEHGKYVNIECEEAGQNPKSPFSNAISNLTSQLSEFVQQHHNEKIYCETLKEDLKVKSAELLSLKRKTSLNSNATDANQVLSLTRRLAIHQKIIHKLKTENTKLQSQTSTHGGNQRPHLHPSTDFNAPGCSTSHQPHQSPAYLELQETIEKLQMEKAALISHCDNLKIENDQKVEELAEAKDTLAVMEMQAKTFQDDYHAENREKASLRDELEQYKREFLQRSPNSATSSRSPRSRSPREDWLSNGQQHPQLHTDRLRIGFQQEAVFPPPHQGGHQPHHYQDHHLSQREQAVFPHPHQGGHQPHHYQDHHLPQVEHDATSAAMSNGVTFQPVFSPSERADSERQSREGQRTAVRNASNISSEQRHPREPLSDEASDNESRR